MADEYIRHLVRNSNGKRLRFAQVEQDAALLMLHPDVEQGIAENTIHQNGSRRSDARMKRRVPRRARGSEGVTSGGIAKPAAGPANLDVQNR